MHLKYFSCVENISAASKMILDASEIFSTCRNLIISILAEPCGDEVTIVLIQTRQKSFSTHRKYFRCVENILAASKIIFDAAEIFSTCRDLLILILGGS